MDITKKTELELKLMDKMIRESNQTLLEASKVSAHHILESQLGFDPEHLTLLADLLIYFMESYCEGSITSNIVFPFGGAFYHSPKDEEKQCAVSFIHSLPEDTPVEITDNLAAFSVTEKSRFTMPVADSMPAAENILNELGAILEKFLTPYARNIFVLTVVTVFCRALVLAICRPTTGIAANFHFVDGEFFADAYYTAATNERVYRLSAGVNINLLVTLLEQVLECTPQINRHPNFRTKPQSS